MSNLLKQLRHNEDRQKAVLEGCDPFAGIRNALRRMASERNDYAGCPIPLDDQELVIEPTFKYQGIADIGKKEEAAPEFKVRNVFWSHAKRCRIAICEDPDGTIWFAPFTGSANTATALLHTLGASDVWGVEQEAKAVQLLGTMLRHRQFKQYLLTGSFLEKSERSGLTYVFRRLRPTVALTSRGANISVLAALCMHPIGYYSESWAGCMCPTDDVIAHLVMMRGDEHMFWRRSNQHPAYDPASGL